eukprot:TRINITY_DN4424_c0_g1_i1.p1 TRINITY_DN4424_c0_g1~~TRINITY_DN4424_c0_g1_i1.p1  ORF type:complete len:661 (+),score=155.67 TRINITY_DN4424_c0_g1_i1:60-2042(+)
MKRALKSIPLVGRLFGSKRSEEWQERKKQSKMSGRDRLFLSPWEKWKKYRRFPLKIVVHLLLTILTVVQAVLIVSQFTYYSRNSIDTWRFFFTPSDYQKNGIFTYKQSIEAVKDSVNIYYTFPSFSLDRYIHFTVEDENGNDTQIPVPPQMTVLSYVDDFDFDKGWTYLNDTKVTGVYDLARDSLGPLTNATEDDKRKFFYRLISMKIKYQFKDLDYGLLGPVLFRWTITQYYDFGTGGGRIQFYIDARKQIIMFDGFSSLLVLTLMSVGIVIVAATSLLLSLKALVMSVRFYIRTKRRFEAKSSARRGINLDDQTSVTLWKDLPLSVRLQFFDLWHILIIVGNSCLLYSSIVGIIQDYGYATEDVSMFVFGTGAMLSCISITKYLEFDEKFYVLIHTMRTCFGNIARFIISLAPIFFGYALFGVIVFSDFDDSFVDFGTTTVTLFALLNGDNLYPSFVQLAENYPYPFIARIYLFSFITLFITAVLNVFIFIIQDAYNVAKNWSRTGTKTAAKTAVDMDKLFAVLESEDIAKESSINEDSQQLVSLDVIEEKNADGINVERKWEDISVENSVDSLSDLMETVTMRFRHQEGNSAVRLTSDSPDESTRKLRESILQLISENEAAFAKEIEEEIGQIKKVQRLYSKRLEENVNKLLSSRSS